MQGRVVVSGRRNRGFCDDSNEQFSWQWGKGLSKIVKNCMMSFMDNPRAKLISLGCFLVNQLKHTNLSLITDLIIFLILKLSQRTVKFSVSFYFFVLQTNFYVLENILNILSFNVWGWPNVINFDRLEKSCVKQGCQVPKNKKMPNSQIVKKAK